MARKTQRRFPIFIAILIALASSATALYYRWKFEEKNEISRLDDDPDGVFLPAINEGMMDAVRNGAVLQFTMDDSGRGIYKILD